MRFSRLISVMLVATTIVTKTAASQNAQPAQAPNRASRGTDHRVFKLILSRDLEIYSSHSSSVIVSCVPTAPRRQ